MARARGSYPHRCRRFKSIPRYLHGILAQLGEHLPYTEGHRFKSCRVHMSLKRGGTGRRTGLKILQDLYSRIGSIPIVRDTLKNLCKAQLDRAFGYMD